MNRGGFLRIVEASVAILAIMSTLFIFYNQSQAVPAPDYSERAANILEEISRNATVRNELLRDDTTSLEALTARRIPENYLSYEVRVCNVDDVCGKSTFFEGEVFSEERVVSANLTTLTPRKVKLFIWQPTV